MRFAESEQDMTAIHQFLIAVAGPAMAGRLNPLKSLQEIIRVVTDEAALMLIRDGHLVGTMGIINPVWWYSDDAFMTDRWHFVLPELYGTPEAKMLLDEAIKLAEASGLPFIHQGKLRKGKHFMPRIYGGESGTDDPEKGN